MKKMVSIIEDLEKGIKLSELAKKKELKDGDKNGSNQRENEKDREQE